MTRSDYNAMFLQWRRQKPFDDAQLESIELTEVMTRFDKMNFEKSRTIIARWHEQESKTVH